MHGGRETKRRTRWHEYRFLLPRLPRLLALFAAAPSAQQKPPLTVGAIFVGSVNDYGYNRSMKDGLDEMKRNIPGLKLIEAENVPETAESERIMEGMIQQGAKLIFATSFGHQQFAFNLAKTHPDVVFEHAGGWMQAREFRQFLRCDASRLVSDGRGRRQDDEITRLVLSSAFRSVMPSATSTLSNSARARSIPRR